MFIPMTVYEVCLSDDVTNWNKGATLELQVVANNENMWEHSPKS
jgi:hypothetical protein